MLSRWALLLCWHECISLVVYKDTCRQCIVNYNDESAVPASCLAWTYHHLHSLLDWPKGSPFPLLMGAFLRLQSGFSSISPLSPVAVISGKNCVACKQEMFICLLSEVRRGPLGAFNTFVCVLRCVDMLLFLTSVLHLWFATSLEIYVANLHGKISSSAVINSPLYVYTCEKPETLLF